MINDGSSDFCGGFPAGDHGSVEAQFVPENICGEGAGCVVYGVRLDGLRVAVKRLSANLRLNAAYLAAYRKEFEIGRQLKHDALPVYRGLMATPAEVYIVMDYVDGVTLERFMTTDEGREYFSDEENVRRFLSELLDAVVYLHRSGVIHCDLKPANIMLRHSDRGVMLIDLDKAYCDTRDLTHGGTPGISDVVEGSKKPTAEKDFAAMGRVVDEITGCAGKTAGRKFRRFRRLCDVDGVSAERLYRGLRPASGVTKTVVVALAILGLIISGIVLWPERAEQTYSQPSVDVDRTSAPGDNETAAEEPVIPNDIQPRAKRMPTPAQESPEKIVITDFDSRMAAYIKENASATAAMRSGKLSDKEFQEMVARVSNLYLSTYNEMIADYRKRYPDATESEIYQAMVDATGASRAYKMMQSFSKEMVDTINARTARITQYPGR